MAPPKTNLVLIGMPGSGKSTIGVILAKRTSRDFVDTDVVIQSHEHRSLQDIVDRDGYMALREIEEKWVTSLNLEDTVIATGGSVVYSDKSMAHLASNGTIIFLDVTLEVLKTRISDYDQRGIARRPDQSFEELFEERSVLYRRYADISIGCDSLNQDEVCHAMLATLGK
jgi:shikimate kinase